MKALLASILAATLSSATLSATISFPNSPVIPPNDPASIHPIVENFVDTGFRFSPNCHLDYLYGMDCARTDLGNNFDNYLGPFAPGSGALYIDFFGKPFSLISLRTAPDGGGGPRHNMDLESNKGGFVSFFEETEMFFTGDEWSNITWLIISNSFAGPGQGAVNFVVSIPEPAPFTLIGIALVGLAFIRRRAMSIA